jgi:methyl-accepting chemotaxis protein
MMQEVFASTEKQLASAEEISHAATTLAELASGLQQQVNRFQVLGQNEIK